MEESILKAISVVGFPIVAYLLMIFKTDKQIETLTTAVNNNTQAINILISREGDK